MNWSTFACVAILLLSGCVGPGRGVVPCDWPPASRPPGATLVADARLAEDVAIRFADGQGYKEGWRASRESCEAVLFASISTTRGVSPNEVAAARAALDTRPFDWIVNLPMVGLCLLIAWPVSRRLRRRFEGETIALIFSLMLASIAIAVAIVALGQLWAVYVEMVRIGNGHLSYRAQRIPWSHHRIETFLAVVAGVWCLSFFRYSISGMDGIRANSTSR